MSKTTKRLCTMMMLAAGLTGVLFASDLEFKLVTLRTVANFREISIFREEMILGTEAIERVVVTDILNDGFDENDVVQLFPSGRALRLAPITPRLDSLLRSYRLPSNIEIHESRRPFSAFDSLSRERRGAQALGYGLLGGISERLERGYRGSELEGYFRVSPSGVSVKAWDFDSLRVFFPPPSSPARPETLLVYRTDTVRSSAPDTVYFPVIRVDTLRVVQRDTVFLPAELMHSARGFYYRFALGTLGSGYDQAHRESSRGRVTLGAGNEWDFGVWDPWISGRQDIHARVGLRFVAEMAPWKSDTLSPRFLSTSAEGMYIPAWDESFFAFGGIRAYFYDDLFWDRARAGWDEDLVSEPAEQKLAHYELTAKLGLDKFAAFGSGKRFGAWLKLSGFVPGGRKSGYDLDLSPALTAPYSLINSPEGARFHWEHKGGTELEGAVSVRIAGSAQMMVSAGQLAIGNLKYRWTGIGASQPPVPAGAGLLGVQQFYQTAAIRFAPVNGEDLRLMLAAFLRNNTFAHKLKDSEGSPALQEFFYPYFEASEAGGGVQFDYHILRLDAGVKYFLPPDGLDAQLRPYGGLHLMFR